MSTNSEQVCSQCACVIPANGTYCQKEETIWCPGCAATELNLCIGHQQMIKTFLIQALVMFSSWGIVLVVTFFLPSRVLWLAAMLATWLTHRVLNMHEQPGPELLVMEGGKPVQESQDDAFPFFLRFALVLRHPVVAYSLIAGLGIGFCWEFLSSL